MSLASLSFVHIIPNCHYDDIIDNVQDTLEDEIDLAIPTVRDRLHEHDLSYHVSSTTIGDAAGSIYARIEMTGHINEVNQYLQHYLSKDNILPFTLEHRA